ncbi:MAG: hypothetical protein ACJAZI_000388 [Cycloclasticus sp.]|jgi:hypothetical protein
MKQTKLSVAVKATLLTASLAMAPVAFSADKELLDILKANGSISQVQYDQLIQKADQPSESSELLKKMAWAGKIQVKGDMRARHETRTSEGFSNADRDRIRARIGVYADVADNVQAGVRLVTGGDNTSTNQTLGGSKDDASTADFKPKDIFLDLAYINWQPLSGLEVIAGKFKQPWEQVDGGLVWDGDLNPEGVAFRYTTLLAGAEMIASTGSLIAGQSDDGDSISQDRKVVFGQLAAKFKVAGAETKAGVSIFDFDNGQVDGNSFAINKGNSAGEAFQLTELFAETNVNVGLPVKFYGHYVTNNNEQVTSGKDTAWLIGAQTKMGKWKASYDYRDIEKNAVYAPYNDSDFADGYSDSKGSMYKLSYEISKNFSVATAYMDAETGNTLGSSKSNNNVDTWQIDLVAKF